MKRLLIKVGLILLCITCITNIKTIDAHACNIKQINYSNPVESKEKLYEDFLSILLTPYLDNAIESYYGRPKNYNEIKVIDIKRVEKGSYFFDVTLQVKTLDDAKNPTGLEIITIRNDEGDIDVVNYKHEDVPVKTSK